MVSIWWYKSTQVSFCLCYLLSAKQDRTMFVSTCVLKWKAPNVSRPHHKFLPFSASNSLTKHVQCRCAQTLQTWYCHVRTINSFSLLFRFSNPMVIGHMGHRCASSWGEGSISTHPDSTHPLTSSIVLRVFPLDHQSENFKLANQRCELTELTFHEYCVSCACDASPHWLGLDPECGHPSNSTNNIAPRWEDSPPPSRNRVPRERTETRSLVFQHVSLEPHADTGVLTPSINWVKCCFSKNFLESF